MSLTGASTSYTSTALVSLATSTTFIISTTTSTPTWTTTLWSSLTSATTPSEPLQTNALKPNFTGGPKLGVLEILIPISAAAWVMLGAACVLSMNANARQGKVSDWVPEWFVAGCARRNKALVVMWWAGVMLVWPALLPVHLVKRIVTWYMDRRLLKRVCKEAAQSFAAEDELPRAG